MEKNKSEVSVVKLNVGGTRFMTTSGTLLNHSPNFFTALLSGQHSVCKDDKGYYFIDRDPEHFRLVLLFLRTGALVLPTQMSEREQLMEEFRFYCISSAEIEASKDDQSLDDTKLRLLVRNSAMAMSTTHRPLLDKLATRIQAWFKQAAKAGHSPISSPHIVLPMTKSWATISSLSSQPPPMKSWIEEIGQEEYDLLVTGAKGVEWFLKEHHQLTVEVYGVMGGWIYEIQATQFWLGGHIPVR